MARPTPAINLALNRRRGHRQRTSGFTLAECLIASVVLAIAVLGLCGALAAATRQTEALEVETRCMALAKQLMEEIASRPFDPPASNDQPGWGAGNADRSLYDDVADYHKLDEQIVPSPSPAHLIDSISFSRTTLVEFRATPTGAPDSAGDFAMISVTVTPSSHADPLTLHRLVTRSTLVRE
jgi:prepilin-type N-terminal cleavage/methylation domain-containing protein